MNIVFLEIGGNLGNKLKNIEQAGFLISRHIGTIISKSSIYKTPPWGFKSPHYFFNQVLQVKTSLDAYKVLSACNNIENKLGRVRKTNQFASRTMDIDILLFNDDVINNPPLLQIPHKRLHLRKFVLVPLNELMPNFIHPVLNKSISSLLTECVDDSECNRVF